MGVLWKKQRTRNHIGFLNIHPISLSFPENLTPILSCMPFLKGIFIFYQLYDIYKKKNPKKINPPFISFFTLKRNSFKFSGINKKVSQLNS